MILCWSIRDNNQFIKKDENVNICEEKYLHGAVAIVFVVDNKWVVIQQRSGKMNFEPWSLTIPCGHYE